MALVGCEIFVAFSLVQSSYGLLGDLLEKNSFEAGLDPAEYFRLKRIERIQQKNRRRRRRRKNGSKTDSAGSFASSSKVVTQY